MSGGCLYSLPTDHRGWERKYYLVSISEPSASFTNLLDYLPRKCPRRRSCAAPVNGVPVMQFTKNSLRDARDHLLRVKITLSPHQQGTEVHSQVSSTTAGSPAPGHTLTALSSLKESTSGANKLKSLWFLEKEVCCQSVRTWAMIKFGGPICGLCLGVPTVGVKSVSGSEWKPFTVPRPLASSPKSHLTPAVSGTSSNSWRKRHYHPLW